MTGAVLSTTASFNAADQLTQQVTTSTLGSHSSTLTADNTFDANGNLATAATSKTSSDSGLLTGLLTGLLGSLLGLGNNGKPQTTSYGYNFDDQLTRVTSVDPTSRPADPAISDWRNSRADSADVELASVPGDARSWTGSHCWGTRSLPNGRSRHSDVVRH